jgi:hypothetical protein
MEWDNTETNESNKESPEPAYQMEPGEKAIVNDHG